MSYVTWQMRRFGGFCQPEKATLITKKPQIYKASQYDAYPENAEGLVKDIAESHFDNDLFTDFFDDGLSGTVVIEILEPENISGFYEVDLERMITATAGKMK